MSYVKHNKIKNTGILYELLSRQITVDVINDTTSPKSVKLFKKLFNKNNELGKEYELYSILLNKKYKNLTHASSLVEAVVKSRRKLSNRRLANEKYNLIKTIKEKYDIKEFFNTRIPNFKVVASVYRVFQSEVGKEDFGPVQKTDSSITITEHITQTKQSRVKRQNLSEFTEQDKELRLLSYQLLVDKFNKKYKNLNENQKNLLKEYINNISNTNSLKDTLKEIVKGLKQDLKKHSKNLKDEVVKIKMTEAIKSINKFCGINDKSDVVKDEYVVQTMRYLELLKELKKSGNKDKKVI